MNPAARQVIEFFDALTEVTQHDVLGELLSHTLESPYSSWSDEELLLAADQVFQELDQLEES